MFKLLSMREYGLCDDVANAERTKKIGNFTLCVYRSLQTYHPTPVNTMDLEQIDYRYLLSGGLNGNICCHDMLPPDLVATHPVIFKIDRHTNSDHHTHSVSSILWYPHDNGLFITLALDKKLKLWDANRLKLADEYDFTQFAYSAHMPTVNSSLIAVAHANGDVRLIDIRSGSSTHIMHLHKGNGVGIVKWFNNNSNLLASGGNVSFFCSVDGRVLFTDIRSSRTYYMCLDRDNVSTVESASTTCETSIRSKSNKSTTSSTVIAHDRCVKSLQFLSDNRHLLSLGSDNCMRLWSIDTGKHLLVNYGHIQVEGQKLVTIGTTQIKYELNKALAYVPSSKSIRVYDIFSGASLPSLNGHLMRVNTCVFNQAWTELYSCSDNINIWADMKKQQNDYELMMRTQSRNESQTTTSKSRQSFSLGQILNRDQWSDDEDES
ncbi:unnamed protein product [Didymodactylos carnosus]|uniref:DNA excision repair protein ERCC-8 n=1 Tax=Didymodactylos carnosus TaxID=1234261 RepID=A0A814C2R4_9BILA|nr:unnamed protein product [Didymodactylos carnosus]CAF0936047.1 unnamed protein product [Didymodactylos carnosus]CAF3576845.1 unnamed protein product [Didymodactylos carnosus]CAF3713231.1 unnamed protein product [Didymodactylos carnosus]